MCAFNDIGGWKGQGRRRLTGTSAALSAGGAAGAAGAAGAVVLAVDRYAEGARAIAADVRGRALALDLSDTAALPGALRAAGVQADVLINCAGIQHVAPVHEFPPEKLPDAGTHARSAVLLARAVLPGKDERGWGRTVNTSSVHGRRASAYKAAYVTAKHGLAG